MKRGSFILGQSRTEPGFHLARYRSLGEHHEGSGRFRWPGRNVPIHSSSRAAVKFGSQGELSPIQYRKQGVHINRIVHGTPPKVRNMAENQAGVMSGPVTDESGFIGEES